MTEPSDNDQEKNAEDYVEQIQPEIAYCINCQPYEDGEEVWVLGDRTSMQDLLEEHEVPEGLQAEVARQLTCDNCGSTLGMEFDVGTKSLAEQQADAQWAKWHTEYATQLDDFVKWLEKYPYLGADHPIGRLFLDQIREFPISDHSREEWWRARPVQGPSAATVEQLGPPPTAPRSEGRYNHHGQRVFYLASSKEDAAAEVLGTGESLAWVQQFKVSDRSRLLDLTTPTSHEDLRAIPILSAGLTWSGAHMTPDDPGSEWKPQYFLPRYIADCARRHGFRGVVFASPKHYGENLVLFDWKAEEVVPVGTPTLVIWTPPEARF